MNTLDVSVGERLPTLPPFLGSRRFSLARKLGEGGFGVVYEALDLELNERLAIKTLKGSRALDLLQFKHEFRELADVSHPNLVTLYDLYSHDDRWFFSMELVEGVDLVSYVRDLRAAGDFDRVLDAVRQLLSGVAALHAIGKLHCDLKPSNVLVTRAHRVVILDFGLITSLGGDAQHAGTPDYMAPERRPGARLDAGSDCYSLGVLLHEAVLDRLPTRDADRVASDREAAGPLAVFPAVCAGLLDPAPQSRWSIERVLAELPWGRSSTAATRSPPVRGLNFVGREAELQRLHEAFAQAAGGAPVLAHLHGPSGIGKTELVRRFLDESRARSPATILLQGRCYDRETVPFKAVDRVIDDLVKQLLALPKEEREPLLPSELGTLARVFPIFGELRPHDRRAAGPADRIELRRHAAAALRELLTNLARRAPLLVFIDDLQWGDADSMQLLRDLLSAGPDAPPALWVLARRASSDRASLVESVLEDLRGAIAVVEIAVGRLAPAEAERLVSAFRDGESEAGDALDAARIVDEAGGNALLLQQLLLSLSRAPRPSGAGWAIESLFSERVDSLSPVARALLTASALVSEPLPLSLLAAAAPEGGQLRAALGQLRFENLIVTSGSESDPHVEVFHDRLRSYLRESIVSREHTLHARLAHRLHASAYATSHPHMVLHHALAAGDRDLAAPYSLAAAAQAESALAFDRAAALYETALELHAEHASRRLELLERRAVALLNCGRAASAAPVFLDAARQVDGTRSLDLRRRGIEQHLISGNLAEGLDALGGLLREIGAVFPATPRSAFLRTLYHVARLRLRGVDFEARDEAAISEETLLAIDTCFSAAKGLVASDSMRGMYFAFIATQRALACGSVRRVGMLLAFVGASFVVASSGSLGRWGERLLEVAASIARSTNDPRLDAIVMGAQAQIHLLKADWRRALEQSDRGLALLRRHCVGYSWEANLAEMAALRALEELGDLAAMSARAAAFLDDAVQRGDRYAEVTARLNLAYVRLAEGRVDEARREADRAVTLWRVGDGFHVQHLYSLRIHVMADLYEARPADAAVRIEEAWPRIRRSYLLRVPTGRIDAQLMRGRAFAALAAASSTHRSSALREARRAVTALARTRRADACAHAAALEASVAATEGAATEVAVVRAIELASAAGMELLSSCLRLLRDGDAAAPPGVESLRRWSEVFVPGLSHAQVTVTVTAGSR